MMHRRGREGPVSPRISKRRLDADGLYLPQPPETGNGKKSKAKDIEIAKQERLAYYVILVFISIAFGLILVFRYYHRNISIEDGREVNEEGMPLEAPKDELNEMAGAAAVDGIRNAVQEVGSIVNSKPKIISASKDNLFITVVIPSVVNTNGRGSRLKAISETWGPEARAIYVVHDAKEYEDTGSNINDGTSVYPKVLVVPPEITAEDGVQRLYHVVREVTESTIDPDFAFFVNDHTFVIPDHACAFLSGKDPADPLYAGHAMRNKVDTFAFNSGAAGYFLSRNTMRGLAQRWEESDVSCSSEGASKWHQGNPGLLTAKCMNEALNVNAIDTRDERGRHKFHAFGLVRSVTGHVDEWYKNKHTNLEEFLPSKIPHKLGILDECCSAETVSFHYVEHSETTALYTIMERVRENPNISDVDLDRMISDLWPKGFRNIGGYSAGLPKENGEEWKSMMTIIRRISHPTSCM